MTIIEHFDIIPPFIVRRLFKGSSTELASASGLSIPTVKRYARLRSWGHMRLRDAQVFATTCGYDPFHPDGTLEYLRHCMESDRPFPHLSKSARQYLVKLLKP